MAAYEPIRDSFREFNRMLTDSQSWNARHASSTADRELKQTMLLNQLEQQKFSNEMTTRAMVISEEGNDRAADKLREDIAHNDRVFKSNAAQLLVSNKLERDRLQATATQNRAVNKLGQDKLQFNIDDAENKNKDRDDTREIEAANSKANIALWDEQRTFR